MGSKIGTKDNISESGDTKSLTDFSGSGGRNSNGASVLTGSGLGGSSDSYVTTSERTYSTPIVAKREQKFVAWSKILVFLVLLLALGVVATATNLLVRHEEQANFEDQVRILSMIIPDSQA
jgi:hypothetical protein